MPEREPRLIHWNELIQSAWLSKSVRSKLRSGAATSKVEAWALAANKSALPRPLAEPAVVRLVMEAEWDVLNPQGQGRL
jgi:hypothetical protein